jgi:hypothetical protein
MASVVVQTTVSFYPQTLAPTAWPAGGWSCEPSTDLAVSGRFRRSDLFHTRIGSIRVEHGNTWLRLTRITEPWLRGIRVISTQCPVCLFRPPEPSGVAEVAVIRDAGTAHSSTDDCRGAFHHYVLHQIGEFAEFV